jgi:hypothetical protein
VKPKLEPHFRNALHPCTLYDGKSCLQFESWCRLCNNNNTKWNVKFDKVQLLLQVRLWVWSEINFNPKLMDENINFIKIFILGIVVCVLEGGIS